MKISFFEYLILFSVRNIDIYPCWSLCRFFLLFLFSLGLHSLSLFCLKAHSNVVLQKCVDYRCERNEYQHSDNTVYCAADNERGKGPHCGQTYASAYDTGIDEVVFKLLNDEKHYDEYKRSHRAYHKYQENADDASDKRADVGNESRYAYNHAYDGGIGEAEDRHRDEEYRSENDRLNTLSREEFREGFYGEVNEIFYLGRVLFGAVCLYYVICLTADPLFVCEEVY